MELGTPSVERRNVGVGWRLLEGGSVDLEPWIGRKEFGARKLDQRPSKRVEGPVFRGLWLQHRPRL